MSEETKPNWPDCGQAQCAQVHYMLDSVLEYLKVKCPPGIYTVGKAVRLMDAIKQIPKPEPGYQVGWFDPHSQRFCYMDEKEGDTTNRFLGYTYPVFARRP